MPQHGVGAKLSRTTWSDDCYWTVSKVKVSQVCVCEWHRLRRWSAFSSTRLSTAGMPLRCNPSASHPPPAARPFADAGRQAWQGVGHADVARPAAAARRAAHPVVGPAQTPVARPSSRRAAAAALGLPGGRGAAAGAAGGSSRLRGGSSGAGRASRAAAAAGCGLSTARTQLCDVHY